MSTKEGSKKDKALDLALVQIDKKFGKGSVMRLGEKGVIASVEGIPTGAISLDSALGIGGVPRGRVTEIFGPEASGKTTLALHILAEAQKLGGYGIFIDAEHAMDPIYAEKLGVNITDLLVSQPLPHWYPVPNLKGKWEIATWGFRPDSCLRRCGSLPVPFPNPIQQLFLSIRSGRRSGLCLAILKRHQVVVPSSFIHL